MAGKLILKDNNRFVYGRSAKGDKIRTMVKLAQFSQWTAEEVDLTQDVGDFYNKMNDNERHFIKHTLAFFAAADGIVNENLIVNTMERINHPDARAFYVFQMGHEVVHSETYTLLIDTLVKDPMEKERLFDAIDTIPCVGKKAAWARRWIDNPKTLGELLVAFAAVEGIFFSGSFCSIYWLKKRGLMPGLTFSNELISRDEGLHCDFACLLLDYYMEPAQEDGEEGRPSDERIADIIKEAVEIELEFVRDSLPVAMLGINSDLMAEYIRFCANRLVVALGCAKLYPLAKNPFDFMDMISVEGKTNFFEKRVGEYAKAGLHTKKGVSQYVFTTNDDF